MRTPLLLLLLLALLLLLPSSPSSSSSSSSARSIATQWGPVFLKGAVCEKSVIPIHCASTPITSRFKVSPFEFAFGIPIGIHVGIPIGIPTEGSCIPHPGFRILAPGSMILDPGSRILDPGSRILEPGSWNQDQERVQDPGDPRMQDPAWIHV